MSGKNKLIKLWQSCKKVAKHLLQPSSGLLARVLAEVYQLQIEPKCESWLTERRDLKNQLELFKAKYGVLISMI